MKKIIIISSFVLLAAATLVACKKDYTCQCSKTYTTGNGTTTSNYSIYTYKDTPNGATKRCNANNTQGSDLGGTYAINCVIK